MRIVVVDGHLLLAETVAVALCTQGHQAQSLRVRRGHTCDSLLDAVRRSLPVVVVLDLDLGPRVDGARLITPLERAGIDVVVLAGTTDPITWGACLAAGAAAVLSRDGELDDVLMAVHKVAIGQPAMPPVTRRELVAAWRSHGPLVVGDRERLTRLTPREHDVLAALAAGRQVPEIAAAVELSPATVRTHVKAILGKLGVSSQLAAAVVLHRYDRQRDGSAVARGPAPVR